jgi:peroxiredoxin
MASNKSPTIKHQPPKRDHTPKSTNHSNQPNTPAPTSTNRSAHAPKTPMPKAKAANHQQKPARDQQPTTRARNQRRRPPTIWQRLARLPRGAWFAIVTGALVIGIIAFAIISSQSSTSPSTLNTQGLLAVGTTAPAIGPLPAADGKTYSLAQYKGEKVVVLEFFAPWCPHCQNETTVLKQLQEQYGDKVQVLGVSASPYGRNYEQGDQTSIAMSDLQWFSTTFGLNYPLLFDPSLKAGQDYGVQGFPTQYIVNKQGVITYRGSGEISNANLQQQINQALGQ